MSSQDEKVKDTANINEIQTAKDLHSKAMGQLKSKVKRNQDLKNNLLLQDKDQPFICGVVEGFYGRPWTAEQRKELFRRMKVMGMNTYMYGPKDDYKHRMYWRDLYSTEESELLRDLIKTAEENDVLFVYAISPGLDIVFGSQKEIEALKSKLFQVRDLGCKAFAILFDDIDPALCLSDLEQYKSSAFAQATISNEMFKSLDMPTFLFCPTEYCSSMANPDVLNSAYLKTLGTELHKHISIMWTGPKVVSKYISVESMTELSCVLKRKITIWDNIHANDYDPKRMFLGPYKGRSTELIPYLDGVLTNPNCEFECNFIAMHTLVTWWKSPQQPKAEEDKELQLEEDDLEISKEDDQTLELSTDPTSSMSDKNKVLENESNKKDEVPDGNLGDEVTNQDVEEAEVKSKGSTMSTSRSSSQSCSDSDYSSHGSRMSTNDIPFNHGNYEPDHALSMAIKAWLEYFSMKKVSAMIRPIAMSGPPLLQETPILPKPITTLPQTILNYSNSLPAGPVSSTQAISSSPITKNELETKKETIKTNELSENLETDVEMVPDETIKRENSPRPMVVDSNIEKASDVEMKDSAEEAMSMDENQKSAGNSPKSNESPLMETEPVNSEDVMMASPEKTEKKKDIDDDAIKEEDIKLLVEMFYLPYEYGGKGLQMIEDFKWLRTNIDKAVASTKLKDEKSLDKALQWTERALKFEEQCVDVRKKCNKIIMCPNRSLVHDIFPYIWDMKGVISMLSSFVKWLGQFYLRKTVKDLKNQLSKDLSEDKQPPDNHSQQSSNPALSWLGPDPEPWMFRGGLSGEFQRLLPLSSMNDLFYQPLPLNPVATTYIVRPYVPTDEQAVYKMCLESEYDECIEFEDFPNIVGERLVGAFLTFSPEYCFVVEDSEGVCGYLVGSANAKEFWKKYQFAYLPELYEKYPLSCESNEGVFENVKKIIDDIHCDRDRYSYADEVLHSTHPSFMKIALHKRVLDQSVAKSLTVCQLSALKSCDSVGVHTIIKASDCYMQDVYTGLGLMEIRDINEIGDNTAKTSEEFLVLGRTF